MRHLDHAEACIETAPDSSLAILDSIDTATLRSDNHRARHALLTTYARYRNYIVETDDSLISTAVDYYKSTSDERHFMQSLYSRATILQYANEHTQALLCARHAFELASEQGDHYWIGKCAERLHSLYHERYNRIEALKHAETARIEYHLAGKEEHSVFSALDLAGTYYGLQRYEEMHLILDSISTLNYLSSNTRLWLLRFKALCYNKINKCDSAGIVINTIIDEYGENALSREELEITFDIFLEKGNIEKARAYIPRIKDNAQNFADTLTFLSMEIAMARIDADYKNEAELLRQLRNIENRIISTTNNDALELADRDYFVALALEKQENAFRTKITALIIIIILLAIVIAYRWFLYRRDKEIENNVAYIHSLNSNIKLEQAMRLIAQKDLQEFQNNALAKNELYTRLFSKYTGMLDSLCSQYFDHDESEISKKSLLRSIKSEIEQLRSDDSIRQICDTVDEYTGGTISKLRSQATWMSENDIAFVAMLIAGFSPKAINVFLGIKPNSVYTKKARIKDRISEKKLPDLELFLKLLG